MTLLYLDVNRHTQTPASELRYHIWQELMTALRRSSMNAGATKRLRFPQATGLQR
jgi:hypothetical protein